MNSSLLPVPLPATKKDDSIYEFKFVTLAFSIDREQCESKKQFAKSLNMNKNALGLKKEYESEDISETDTKYYLITGKRYGEPLQETFMKTGVSDIQIVVDLYRWKVNPKKPFQQQIQLP